jgi:hypothetical protein
MENTGWEGGWEVSSDIQSSKVVAPAPKCPINEHLGSIYRVVRVYHYNAGNAPVQLPRPTTQRSRIITIFSYLQ